MKNFMFKKSPLQFRTVGVWKYQMGPLRVIIADKSSTVEIDIVDLDFHHWSLVP